VKLLAECLFGLTGSTKTVVFK